MSDLDAQDHSHDGVVDLSGDARLNGALDALAGAQLLTWLLRPVNLARVLKRDDRDALDIQGPFFGGLVSALATCVNCARDDLTAIDADVNWWRDHE